MNTENSTYQELFDNYYHNTLFDIYNKLLNNNNILFNNINYNKLYNFYNLLKNNINIKNTVDINIIQQINDDDYNYDYDYED
tara:strand:+ start:1446 stop:1691 length:246 start_codon:yes stop_codon:yes gene_type:complete